MIAALVASVRRRFKAQAVPMRVVAVVGVGSGSWVGFRNRLGSRFACVLTWGDGFK
jgi:hypothetical protein